MAKSAAKKAPPREPAIQIAAGQTGVGKTYRTMLDLVEYHKLGRKVLILDFNDEPAYHQFKTLYFDVNAEDELAAVYDVLKFSNQRLAEIRRIVPYTVAGRPMERDEKAKCALLTMKYFHGGWLVMEDYSAYFSTSRQGAFISSITTNRHRRQDITIHVQSLRKIDSSLGENVTFLRLHKQVDPVSSYADKFPNAALVEIATLVVDKHYGAGNKRYYCYVNVRENTLLGVSQADFEEAARRYLQENPRLIDGLLRWEDDHGRRVYPTRQAAITRWITERASWLAGA